MLSESLYKILRRFFKNLFFVIKNNNFVTFFRRQKQFEAYIFFCLTLFAKTQHAINYWEQRQAVFSFDRFGEEITNSSAQSHLDIALHTYCTYHLVKPFSYKLIHAAT